MPEDVSPIQFTDSKFIFHAWYLDVSKFVKEQKRKKEGKKIGTFKFAEELKIVKGLLRFD